MTDIKVTGAKLAQAEIDAYINHVLKENPNRTLESLQIDVDGDYVNLTYNFDPIPFDRIRRITGYLVGTTRRWNNAKKAELRDRVKHGLSCDCNQ